MESWRTLEETLAAACEAPDEERTESKCAYSFEYMLGRIGGLASILGRSSLSFILRRFHR